MSRTACVAALLATAIGTAPSAFAQTSRVAPQIAAGGPQGAPGLRGGARVFVDVPIGRVRVSPQQVDGEFVYVRRQTIGAGMTMVEVSTTPFQPLAPTSAAPAAMNGPVVRPETQPAPW